MPLPILLPANLQLRINALGIVLTILPSTDSSWYHSWMRKRKAQREHQYFRVVITYTDGETSGNRVFKDKTKAEKWAERHKKSLTVRK